MLPRPTWTALVGAVSLELIALLAANGEPALNSGLDGSAGSILIGPQFVWQQGYPPRVLFVPDGFDFSNERSYADRQRPGTRNGQMVESSAISTHRAIARQWKRFQVQCWACNFSDANTPAPEPSLDYDAAESLADYVWRACQIVAAGAWRTTKGQTSPTKAGQPIELPVGRVFVFDLSLDTPISEVPLQLAPPGTKAQPTTLFQSIGGGTPEMGCQG